jgi:type IV pilus assembly protein PilE
MRQAGGFTLIEVMIAVAIVAILAAIGVPSYNSYVQRGKIAEAASQLSAMRVKMEQYFQDNRTYVGACVAGTVATLPSGNDARYFSYACSNLGAATYTVTATGVSTLSMGCFTYYIDQNNTRTTVALPSDWSGAASTCWVLRKDGSC